MQGYVIVTLVLQAQAQVLGKLIIYTINYLIKCNEPKFHLSKQDQSFNKEQIENHMRAPNK